MMDRPRFTHWFCGEVSMARYTSLFKLAIPLPQLHDAIQSVLSGCNFNVLHNTNEYVMAKEIPGGVPFAKLVVVELLIDRTTATDQEVSLKCVVKNEELPLQVNNHCHTRFDQVVEAFCKSEHWRVIENIEPIR
jgi:hypothetical protein